MFRILFKKLSPCICIRTRTGYTLCTPRLHEYPSVRFLIVAYPYHVYFAFKPELATCKGKCTSPLACSCFRGKPLYTKSFVVICLCYSCIGLMASWRAYTFVLEIYTSRCFKELL